VSATARKVHGGLVPIYRNSGQLIIGTDEEFTDCIELELPSFLEAMEKLGFAVIPLEATA
jgi:hypothetical protein